jgi:hypothetical protein
MIYICIYTYVCIHRIKDGYLLGEKEGENTDMLMSHMSDKGVVDLMSHMSDRGVLISTISGESLSLWGVMPDL